MTFWHPGFARALRAAQTGDNEAFCDLWRMTNPALRRYLRVTAPRVGDDVASATWVRVARNLRHLRGGERDFRALVARIARDEAALRRRNRLRRSDPILDPVEAIRDAVGAGRAALGPQSLTGETAVGLLTRLPDDVAEMVALRVVLGLDAGDTGSLVGQRPGSVIVAVHSGLRRTSNLVGASAARAASAPGAASPVAPPSPWALDRLLDLGADGRSGLDPALRAVVAALEEPGSPGDPSRLAPALAALERPLHRSFALPPTVLLPLLARRLGAARTMLTGKVAAVAVGTAVLSAPAALACSEPTPGTSPAVVTAASTRGDSGGLLAGTAAAQAAWATDPSTLAPAPPAAAPPPGSTGSATGTESTSQQADRADRADQADQADRGTTAQLTPQAGPMTSAGPAPHAGPTSQAGPTPQAGLAASAGPRSHPHRHRRWQHHRHHHGHHNTPWWLVYLLRHG